MAKLTNPLHSITAHGALGQTITFNQTKHGATAKQWHRPTGAPSSAQATRRSVYADGVSTWKLLSNEQKNAWANIGQHTKLTGFNAFMSDYLKTNAVPQGIQWDGGTASWDSGAAIWLT